MVDLKRDTVSTLPDGNRYRGEIMQHGLVGI